MFRTKLLIAEILLLLLLGAQSVQAQGTAEELLPRIIKAETALPPAFVARRSRVLGLAS